MTDLTRRAILATSAALVLAPTAACAQSQEEPLPPGVDTLVAYFTRSGNTKVIAGTLQRERNADLFEIRPATPYPPDYEATVAQNHRQKLEGVEPPLAQRVAKVADYRTIFLGFPIWDGTAPPVIRSFLAAHDLAGRVIRPFITHGGFGIGDSIDVLRKMAPGVTIADPFTLECDQERRTIEAVRAWIAPITGD